MPSRVGRMTFMALAGACLLAACDKSPQTADGSVTAGDPGTAAATGNGTIAATGSPEQGGANGTPTDKTVRSGMMTNPDGSTAAPPNEAVR